MTIDTDRQFEGNLGIMTPAEWERMSFLRVLVVGLGGLGGHVAAGLARLGVRSMVLVDYDRFEATNLNRQLFATHVTIGKYKAEVLYDELKKIRPGIDLEVHYVRIEDLNPSVFDRVDMIVDAVDAIPTKLHLETMAETHKRPLLHGAVGGWYGQLGVLLPGSRLLHELYEGADGGLERDLGSPTFTPAVVANMMLAEFVKFALARPGAVKDEIMMVDLLHHDYRVVARRKR